MPTLLVKEPLSEAWFAARRGRLTASRFNDILNGTPTGWSRIIDELNGDREGFRGNAATDWGTENEDGAITLFELQERVEVERTGFWIMDDFPFIGGTPDGLLGSDYTLQVKCPYNPEVHLKSWRDQRIPGKYIPQVQGELMITGRSYAWFISYDPRADIDKQLVKILIPKNQNYIDALLVRLLQFYQCWKESRDPLEYFLTAKVADPVNGSLPKLF